VAGTLESGSPDDDRGEIVVRAGVPDEAGRGTVSLLACDQPCDEGVCWGDGVLVVEFAWRV